MPRIHHQAKTFFTPLSYIVAAGLSVAFATSAFAQVTQPRQAKPTRSEVTPRARTNEKIDAKACVDADIERYVLNLGTPKLSNDEFEALVRCGASAVPALSQALKNDRADVRTSAAYILGRIGKESSAAIPELTATLKATDSHARAAAAYALGEIGPKAIEAVPSLTSLLKDKNEDFVIRYRAAYALKQINSEEALLVVIAYQKQIDEWEVKLKTQRNQNFTDLGRFLGGTIGNIFPTQISQSVRYGTSANRPVICLLPGIQNILPRCR